MEKLQATEEETSDKEFENEDHPLITSDVGELLVIQRKLMVKRFIADQNKGNKSFILSVQLQAKCVSLSLMEKVAPM